jgi:hypothetical protein
MTVRKPWFDLQAARKQAAALEASYAAESAIRLQARRPRNSAMAFYETRAPVDRGSRKSLRAYRGGGEAVKTTKPKLTQLVIDALHGIR